MTQDLSVHHHPVHSLLMPTNQWAPAEYALSNEQLEFFHECGYLKGVRILSDEQVEVLRGELAGLLDARGEERDLFYEYNSNESGDPNHVLFHALGAWRIAPGFHDLLWHPAFTIPAGQLLGGAVRFWHDQLFCKPAHHGRVVAWHQDYSYWTRTKPLAHLTCWIGLDDSTHENGCLQYIARSHRWPDLPITGLAGDMDAISAVLDNEQRKEMPKPFHVPLLFISVASFLAFVRAQETPATNHTGNLKTLVVATEAKSDAAIAIPPIASVTVNVKNDKHSVGADAADLTAWLSKEAALNGLQSADLQPWHIVVTYDQFDEDGDNVHSGVYEEYWAGAKKYKRIYKSDNLNETDYATEKGLYRLGDQQWPDRAQLQVRSEIVDPFSYAATLVGFRGRTVERTFSGYQLQCVLEKDSEISNPTQYCFEPDGSVLRYSKGFGWFQTVYNDIAPFQGRSLAQAVEVTDGGKPYLKLRVATFELISHVDDADFVPPPTAIGPLGDRVSGVHPVPIKTGFPQWPASLRSQHFTVTAEVVIGKDGHVVSARAVSGPAEGYKACEDSARKWVFKPYLILDKPVEVEARISCSNN